MHLVVTASAATAGGRASAAARWAGLARTARNATPTLAVCTAPATALGSVSARKVGEACCVMKVDFAFFIHLSHLSFNIHHSVKCLKQFEEFVYVP